VTKSCSTSFFSDGHPVRTFISPTHSAFILISSPKRRMDEINTKQKMSLNFEAHPSKTSIRTLRPSNLKEDPLFQKSAKWIVSLTSLWYGQMGARE
jgi:hypothetical protein